MTTARNQGELDRLHARVSDMEQERKRLLAIIEILQEIAGSLHAADIVRSVALRLGEAFGLDRCSVFLADRGGGTVRLVASYEDPAIRNYVVDLDRYPELRRALQTGETVLIPDAATDPSLAGPAQGSLAARGVKTITVVPISWKGVAIGAIFLRTFRDGSTFSDADLQFCQMIASLTAKALRNAHRFERLQRRNGDDSSQGNGEREQAALIAFLRHLLAVTPRSAADGEDDLAASGSPEIRRLVDVAQAVLSQTAASR
jgi:two-component system cell cycle response regulator